MRSPLLVAAFALATSGAVACVVGACSSDDGAGAARIDPDAGSSGSSGTSGTSGGSSGTSGQPGDGEAPLDGDVDGEAPPPPKPVYVVSTHETTTFNGVPRKYNLSLPVDYDAAKTYPLVLVFHGSPSNADVMLMYDPFDGASQKNAIVAYPNALNPDWDLTASTANVDMLFTQALVGELAAKYTIDTGKVLGVGWSGGGFFVNMLACTFPNVMKAFAAHAGGAPYNEVVPGGQKYPNNFPKCGNQQAPVAAFIFHGQADPAVPYGSGEFESTYWGYVNGCSDSTTATAPAPCVTHDNCPAGKPVVFCGYPGHGHGVEGTAYATTWALFGALP